VTIVRRNHGKGHSYTIDGGYALGVTRALDLGFPKSAIPRWAARVVAACAIDEADHLATLGISERLEYLKTAPDRDRDAAARRGTEVHHYAQILATGETADIPEELVGHVDAYLRFAREWQPRELLVEAVVAKRQPRYCGTLDLVADLADGRRWLLDLKTTRSGVFNENALQLAAYRHADVYLGPDGAELEMPAVDRCGVVWLRADGYDLVPVEAGEPEFLLFQMVARIARFADRQLGERLGEREVIGDALRPPEVSP